MMDTCFQTLGGNMIAASKLAIGVQLVDHQGQTTCVKWCQVYRKEKRLLVDLHTKESKLTVTGSHRVVVPGGECTQAKDLSKNDEVMVANSSGTEQLLKVTKRTACIQVVELEFDRDATVPVWVPTILTKGSVGASCSDYPCSSHCKEEQVEMEVDEMGGVERPCTDSGADSAGSTMHTGSWPDTDDGF